MHFSPKLILILIFTFLLSSCAKKEAEYIDIRGLDYTGAQSCIQCHAPVNQSHVNSLHHLATRPGISRFIKGSFSKNSVFSYDSITKLVMEKRKDSFYQVLYINEKEIRAYNMKVLFGSENAQTSVYWNNGIPYELPVSYYSEINQWGGSPGGEFGIHQPNFTRPITRDCFSCHSSHASGKVDQSVNSNPMNDIFSNDIIDPESIIYGIDCERCHGPGRNHVDFHIKFPDSLGAKFITNMDNLSRKQELDACAICHSGDKGMKLKSRFGFMIGDKIEEYFRPLNQTDTANMDVHGNQYQLLTKSKCFIKSETLNCISCHNAHGDNSKNFTDYSKVCIDCHSNPNHTSTNVITLPENLLSTNCIDCHMPKKSSKAIQFHKEMDSTFTKYNLRSHLIAVYKTTDLE